jgi:transposase
MKINVKKLPTSIDELHKIIFYQQTELASYKEKYARLIEEIRLAKQHRFGPSSEKNVLQQDIFDEPGIEFSKELKDQLDDEEIEIKSHTRKKHPVRKKLPAYLPREVVLHDIPEEEKTCACGEYLVRMVRKSASS